MRATDVLNGLAASLVHKTEQQDRMIASVREFLNACQRKLPTEGAINKDKERKRKFKPSVTR